MTRRRGSSAPPPPPRWFCASSCPRSRPRLRLDTRRGSRMIWFWSRAKEKLQLETRFDNHSREYVLTVRYPDDRHEFERFPDEMSFRHRLASLERQLEADHWVQSGRPAFDSEG